MGPQSWYLMVGMLVFSAGAGLLRMRRGSTFASSGRSCTHSAARAVSRRSHPCSHWPSSRSLLDSHCSRFLFSI